MNEFELIDRYFRRAPRNADVRVGIGDDGAVIAPTPGMEYVLTVDMLVEGRHFAPGCDARALGHKTLAMTGRYVNRPGAAGRALADRVAGRLASAWAGVPAAEVVPLRKPAPGVA